MLSDTTQKIIEEIKVDTSIKVRPKSEIKANDLLAENSMKYRHS